MRRIAGICRLVRNLALEQRMVRGRGHKITVTSRENTGMGLWTTSIAAM